MSACLLPLLQRNATCELHLLERKACATFAHGDDDALLAASIPLFDALYAALQTIE